MRRPLPGNRCGAECGRGRLLLRRAVLETLEIRRLLSSGLQSLEPLVAVEPPLSGQQGAQALDPSTSVTIAPVHESLQPVGPVSGNSLTVPALSSLPSANAKLYLDFDGQTSLRWGSWAGFGGNVTGDIPAFDTDGDPTSFSANELNQIHQIWGIVSEKYSPFNLDVTTIDPGSLQDRKSLKIVIGGDGKWYGKGGGVSIVGGFNGNYLDNNKIGFVWDGQGGGGDVRYVGEAAAHEAGHIFGLLHRSDFSDPGNPIEYAPGFVMGRGDKGLGLWSVGDRGDYPWSLLAHAEVLQNVGVQDDVAIISGANNGFGFRPDEAGPTAGGAATMTLVNSTTQQSTGQGVITTPSDVDAWRFSWSGGALSLSARPSSFDGMLSSTLELRDSSFNLLATAAAPTAGQTITMNLPLAGTYYAVVHSRGQYSDIGQYTVTAEINQLADNTIGSATHFGLFGATSQIFQITSPFEGHAHFSDFVGSSDPEDFYSFDTGPIVGTFTATLTGLSGDADLELIRDFNNNGVVDPGEIRALSDNSGTTPESIAPTFLGPNARYYIHVNRFGTANTNYTLDCYMDEAGNSRTASYPSPARQLGTGGGINTYYDYVDSNDVDDYYQLDADNVGYLSLTLNQLTADADLYLYDSSGTQLASSTNTGTASEQISNYFITSPGTYYVQVRAYQTAATNYALGVNLDYAPFDFGTGTLLPSTPLPNVGSLTGEVQVHDYVGSADAYDVFKMTVPPGRITVNQTTSSTYPHNLELIYDANGNNQVDPGDVLASGTNTLTYNVPDLSGGGLALVFLRVSVNHAGEFNSDGNYTLTVAGRDVADLNNTLSSSEPLGTGGSGQANLSGQLYWSPDDGAVNNTDNFYRFTISSPQQFNAMITSGATPAGPWLQVIKDTNGNGQLDTGERLAGANAFSADGRSSIAVNLPAGTYYLRVFIPEPEREDQTLNLPYSLSTSLSAQTDTTPPTVMSASFDPNIALHGLSVRFSEDVADSLDLSDLHVQRLSDSATFAPVVVQYDPSTNTAGFSLGRILPDGNYRLTIPAGSITDAAGNPLAADFTYDFFVLAGDANHDRIVDVTDLGILATNWQGTGKTFAQGDFNYDGVVDVTDLGILATNWQKNLPAPAPATSVSLAAMSSPLRHAGQKRSIIADVLG